MNDDLDDEMMGDDGFDEFAQSSGLGDTIRQSPAAKVGVVLAGVALVAGALFMFGGDGEERVRSTVATGSDLTSVPGEDDEVDLAYIDAVEQQNEADLERARNEQGSTIPVPIETQDTRLAVPEVEDEVEDPLHRWRALQEERVQRQMKSQEVDLEPVTVLDAEQQSEAINELAESMVEQMDAVLTETSETKNFTTRTLITYTSVGGDGAGGQVAGGGGADGGDSANSFTLEEEETIIIPAGKIVYGELLLEAHSDVPSLVLAHMVSGPLKGWKLLGEFSIMEDIELMAITFSVAVNEDGDQYDINAIMLNPETTLAAMRTGINHHYFKRIVFPAAAAFVEGFSNAIAESGRTSVTVSGDTVIEEEEEKTDDQEVATGIAEAGEEISEIIDDMSDVPVTIIIAAGTPIGIFFTENVVEKDEDGDI